MIDTQDLLFELGTEELPPVALKRLSEALLEEFTAGLENASLSYDSIQPYAAPRRLALVAKNCATRQPDRDVQRKGPAVKAAFDADGNPTKAAEGFARSCGTTVDQLDRESTDKGEWLSYRIQETGKPAAALLPEIANKALGRLPIPKRMRWGDSDAQFVRPVHWLLFLHGNEVVPCDLMGIKAGNKTYGHRFHHPDSIEISSADDYPSQLKNGHVIASFADRRATIREQVNATANKLGGQADMDDALLDEVTALVEWPVPISAGFEEKYLQVPNEALIYTMKKNQKYFPVLDNNGGLMNRFITIANIDSSNPEVISDGNERVVRPRLADAMFFWEQDGKKRLEDHLDNIKSVVFQQKLGSMYDKSVRVSNLAGFIAEHIDGSVDLAKRAGLLSRCDLMTEMVGEFADMQGIMGMYQARRDGEPEELAQAMNEFYMPRYSGDQLPQSKTGIAISLAEKIDTLVGIFAIDMKPTGDKDPFALRRAALGALRILREHQLDIDLQQLLARAVDQLESSVSTHGITEDVYQFMLSRLKGMLGEAGTTTETFDAVVQRKPSSILDFDKRIDAVVAFQQLPEAEALAAANKRIGNILKKADFDSSVQLDVGRFDQAEEIALHKQLIKVSEEVTPLLLKTDYEATLKSLAVLRDNVDAFFDNVMVMHNDAVIRNNRLALLTRLQDMFLQVADISRLS